ncbi:MAG: hypothetical protein KA371_10460 [Acidobacteria bacterium]|nr:hypothetical protein [Acidobacteriota bacterium]
MPRRLVVNVFTGEETWQEYEQGTPVEDPEAAKFLIALTGLALSPWLYPLLSAAVGAAVFVASEIVDVLRLAPPTSYAVIAGAALVVYVLAMRVEQRLGTIAPYRWLRHLLRLAVPAGALYLAASGEGQPVASDVIGGAVFVAVIAQALLWFARSMRDDWHIALRAMRLRARSLLD